MDPRTTTHSCISRASLSAWIRNSQPGARVVYATDDSGNSFANSNREFQPKTQKAIFNNLYALQKLGAVMLFQKHDRHIVTYIAIRISPRTLEFVERLAKNAG